MWVPFSGLWLRGLEKAGGGLGLILGLSGDMKGGFFSGVQSEACLVKALLAL